MKIKLCHLVFSVLLLGVTVHASLIVDIPCPQDDVKLKFALWEKLPNPSFESDRKTILSLEESLRTLKESHLKKLLGDEKPFNENFVLPLCHHTSVGFSGVNYKGDEKNYFLLIKDLGGILVFPLGGDDFISGVALYLKTDKNFKPLKKLSDASSRRDWDIEKVDQIKKAVEEILQQNK